MDELGVVPIPPEDPDLLAAYEKAAKSLDGFIAELQQPDGRVMIVKAEVKSTNSQKIEYIWVENLSYERGKFTGTLANEPVDLGELVLGSKVTFDRKKVKDWYIDDGKSIKGNFTAPVMEKVQKSRGH